MSERTPDGGLLRSRDRFDLSGRSAQCDEREHQHPLRMFSLALVIGIALMRQQIGRQHFILAAKNVRRRITPEVIRSYEEWRDSSGLRSA